MVKHLCHIGCLLVALGLGAQPKVEDFKQAFRLQCCQTNVEILVDGQLDEDAWLCAEKGSSFWQKLPYFAPGADPKTEVMLTYDDKFLYVGAKCYQEQKVFVQSLVRDQYWDNDGIAIILDPLHTRTNAFIFGVTAVGAQWDALKTLDAVNDDWSNKWYSETYEGEGYWSMEMAIPFSILRFDPAQSEWGMNFVRNHMNENEYHNWTAVPESFWPADPAFSGSLVFDVPPKAPKRNVNFIPYVTTSIQSEEGGQAETPINAGLDARMSITPTLNLDLTVNPDFSQVEADQLVTNLTRFNIFLPERRTFFLENGDLFGDFGYPSVRPFFSRTIGLDEDRQAVPILFGARLTGNVNPSVRIGAMNIHTASGDSSLAQNQSAVSVQKRFGRSFIQGMFVNRQAFDGTRSISDDFGRNAGLEGAYISDDGQFSAWGAGHLSWKPGVQGKTGFYTGGVAVTKPNWEALLAKSYVQENYYADLGFIVRIENTDAERDTTIRVGFREHVANFTYRLRPVGGIIARHDFSVNNFLFLNPDWSFNERNNSLGYSIAFRSTALLNLAYNSNEVELLFPFTFVEDGEALPARRYHYNSFSAGFRSDARKAIWFDVSGQTGGFYNGRLDQWRAAVNFRWQPWVNWNVAYEWNKISLPDAYGETTIPAMLTRLEVGINKNLFWTTIFQYLDQSDFIGINSRIQWRFAPMSDIFLVYIDNYSSPEIGRLSSYSTQNRALVLKINYWY